MTIITVTTTPQKVTWMLDDFFTRALLAGIGIALAAGPLGTVMVWRRMAYFGDTLAHSALLGVVLGLVLQVETTLTVFALCAAIALGLYFLMQNRQLGADTLLGMLSHSTLALGIIALSLMSWLQVDLNAFLFGDILAVSASEIGLIYGVFIVVAAAMPFIWRALVAASISEDIAIAEGMSPKRANIAFIILIALAVAVSMKLVGILLTTALLIIPPAAARRFAASPEQMAIFATAIGAVSVVLGLFTSLAIDIPAGPATVLVSAILFGISRISASR